MSQQAAHSAAHSVTRPTALIRGALGWLVLTLGLGVSIGLVEVLDQRIGLPMVARFVVQALVMSSLVVPTVLLLRTRLDGRTLRGLGWAQPLPRPVAIGTSVGLVSGVVVWLPALLAGWIRVDHVDVAEFATFLTLGGAVLVLYEALPEELALRGYAWTNLRDGWGSAVATVVVTALFPLSGPAASLVATPVVALLGGTPAITLGFPGGDAVAYVLQLVLFGLALVAARRVPLPGALFVAVAFHWTSLTVTRTLLGGLSWMPSGWDVTFVEPDAVALVLVQLVVGGLLFVALRSLGRRRAPRQDRRID